MAMSLTSRRLLWVPLMAMLNMAGCASVPRPDTPGDAAPPAWQGRLALKVDDQPSLSFSSGFELKGSAPSGELSLLSPLGSTLAHLRWLPGKASLHTPTGVQDFASLDQLMEQLTGTAVPVAALFDWLEGTPTPVNGWQIDLSQQAQGRLLARRATPPTELRVILERP